MNPELMQAVQNIGAMGILGLAVWNIPRGVIAIKDLLSLVIDKVQKAHTEAMTGNQQDISRLINMMSERQTAIVDSVEESTRVMRSVVERVNTLVELHGVRVPAPISGSTEHAKLVIPGDPRSGSLPQAGPR